MCVCVCETKKTKMLWEIRIKSNERTKKWEKKQRTKKNIKNKKRQTDQQMNKK